MKYLDYINHFWRINEMQQLPVSAICLYFYLLNVANKVGWGGAFTLTDAKIMADLAIQRTALASARKALEKAGLINIQNRGNGRGKTLYDITPPQHKITAQNIQITPENKCTKRAFKNVKNCTDNCTKRAVSHLINNILSNTNVLSNIFYNKTKNNIDNSEYKYSSSSILGDDDGDVDVKNFIEKITDKHFVQNATIALSISQEQYFRLAQAIMAEWLLTAPENFSPENSPLKHLFNQLRIKRDCHGEQKACAEAHARRSKEQEQKACAEQEQKERAVPRGSSGLKAYLASKGLSPEDSILNTLSSQSSR